MPEYLSRAHKTASRLGRTLTFPGSMFEAYESYGDQPADKLAIAVVIATTVYLTEGFPMRRVFASAYKALSR